MIPHVKNNDKVILFDGECNLCNAWCQFVIRFDKHHNFKLLSMQTKKGQEILAYAKLPTDNFETMLLLEQNIFHAKSDAFLRIVRSLPMPFKFLFVLKIFPSFIRDFFYDLIAKNRYKLFGKNEHCLLPTADHKNRYL